MDAGQNVYDQQVSNHKVSRSTMMCQKVSSQKVSGQNVSNHKVPKSKRTCQKVSVQKALQHMS